MDDVIIKPSILNAPVSQQVKPNYLIFLSAETKSTSENRFFITSDRPDISSSQMVIAKGFFIPVGKSSDETIEMITNNYQKLVAENAKSFTEMMFPACKIIFVKNLVFRVK